LCNQPAADSQPIADFCSLDWVQLPVTKIGVLPEKYRPLIKVFSHCPMPVKLGFHRWSGKVTVFVPPKQLMFCWTLPCRNSAGTGTPFHWQIAQSRRFQILWS